MKLGLLSRDKTLYSTRRIVEEAEKRDHTIETIDYLRCFMHITSDNPSIMYKGHSMNFDAVIARIGASNTFYGSAVLRQFEMKGIYCPNGSQGITRSRNKLRSLQILAREGIGLPNTSFAHSTQDIKGVIEAVGGAPLVVKLLEGSRGTGVILAPTNKAAESVIAAFKELKANILVQEFIKEADSSDIRVFIIGDKVVAAMRRKGAPDDFRSNLHRGGTSEKVKLTVDEKKTALKAAKAMNLSIAGVDIIRSARGPLVLEINSSPGLEGIEKTSGVNVAQKMIIFIEDKINGNTKIRKQKDV